MENLEKIMVSADGPAHPTMMGRAKKGMAAMVIAATALMGAYATPAEAERHRAVARGVSAPVVAQAQQLTPSEEPEGRNSAFLGDMVENYRAEVFRKEGDAWANHPGRTNNWKWGTRLGIFDYGCDNVVTEVINEWDQECPTGPNPPRRLTANNYFSNSCPPQVRANRMSEESALVSNATDDDFMKIYNAPTGLEIDNLRADSTYSIPGVGTVTEKMDRSYTADVAAALGLNLGSVQDVQVDRWQMDQIRKYVQAANDPHTIFTVTQAEDAAGNPLCDVLAVTAYAVRFQGAAAEGVPSTVHKTIAANLYLKENKMVRTFLDTSVHGSPEIFAGEPALDARENLGFAWGVTNKYKVSASQAETYVPFDELNAMWERVNVADPGKRIYRGDAN